MALREILAKFGFQVDDSALKAGKKGVDGFANSIKGLTEKIVGGDVGDWIKDTISDLKDQASQFRGVSNQLGISTQALQQWQTAGKLAGVETTQLNAAFRFLQKNAAGAAHDAKDSAQAFVDSGDGALEAALSGKAAAETFKGLGVEVKDSAGNLKETTVLMREVGLAIGQIKNPAERTAVAMKVFGRQGTALIPLFNKGAEGLDKLLAKLDELGGGISDETLESLKANTVATKEYDIALTGLKSGLVGQLLPGMTKAIKLAASVLGSFVKATKGTHTFAAVILVLGAAFATAQQTAIVAGIKTALAWAPTLLAIGLLVLLVDDLWTAFEGGDSVIGRLVEKLGGHKEWLEVPSAEKWGEFFDTLKRNEGVDLHPPSSSEWEEFFDRITDWSHRPILDSWKAQIHEGTDQMVKDIEAWARGTLQKGEDWAKGLIDGLVKGLRGGMDRAVTAVGELGDAIISKLRGMFQWHSPSGLLEHFGLDLDMGAIKGMAKGKRRLEAATEQTFDAAMPTGRGADFQPVIKVQPSEAAAARQIHIQNNVQNQINAQTGNTGIREAVRQGTSSGLDDLNATLAATEALA